MKESVKIPQLTLTKMETHSFDQRWSNSEKITHEHSGDALLPFPIQHNFSSQHSGYSALHYQLGFPIQETAFDGFPEPQIYPNDPICPWQDCGPEFLFQDIAEGDTWNIEGNHVTAEGVNVEEKQRKRAREEKGNSSKSLLSRNTISKYFYLPITQAAKELNIGVTLLKKRCRELGIRRWPHRKLMSLQTLIKNVEEMSKEGEGVENPKVWEVINILENEKKLMEEVPDLQLEDQTKRLRQACFKANYKKRKMVMQSQNQCSYNSYTSSQESYIDSDIIASASRVLDDDEQDMKALFADCFPPCDSYLV